MKLQTLLILFTLANYANHAQHPLDKSEDFIPCGSRDFKNGGDQEDCWHEEAFVKNYAPEIYARYGGAIKREKQGFGFDGKVLFTNGESLLIEAASTGLLYPQLLVYDSVLRKDWTAWKAQSANKRTIQDIIAPDTISLSIIKEITAVSSPQRRRFSCWMMTPRLANPMFIYLEFTNKNATPGMEAKAFMAGATLTFLKRGGLII